jgi:hypothetical protein
LKHINQLNLFRAQFHAIFVHADGRKSTVIPFHNKDDMRKLVIAKMRIDKDDIAYSHLCHWTGMKVQLLETIYYGDKKLDQY